MAKLGNIYNIPFGRAGMVTHQNRWLTQAGDLSIAQNVTFENDMLQKEPAAAHYDTTGLAVEAPNGTFSGATDSTCAAIWLPASASTAFGTVLANTVISTTSPWVASCNGSAVAGSLVVVAVGQRINKTDNPILTGMTDSEGNTYTRQKTTVGSGAIDSDIEIWTSILTNPLHNVLDSFMLTFTTATADDRALVIASYSLVSSGTTEATATSALDNVAVFSSASNTYAGRSYPGLLLAAVHWPKINTTTATWLGGFTQNAAASSVSLLSQISLASKLVVFSTAIVAQFDWKADGPLGGGGGGGSVSTTTNSTIVTGAGTSFLTDFVPGDEIQGGGETQLVNHV